MRDRAQLITEIARYTSDISHAMEELQKYPWDCDKDIYLLTRADISKIFERYLSDEITNQDLGTWASFLELREDLGYEPGSEEIIDRVIFLLANPEINFPINKALVTELKNTIWEAKT